MSLELGNYVSYTPGRNTKRDRVYERMQQRWGSQLQSLPRLDKLQALSALTLTLTYIEDVGSDYDLSCAFDDLSFEPLGQAGDFLAMAAELPTSEYLSLAEALINQLKWGRD